MSAFTPHQRLASHLRELASNTRKAIPMGDVPALIDENAMHAAIDFAERMADAIDRMPAGGIAGELAIVARW